MRQRLRVSARSPYLLIFFVALHGAAIFLFLNGFFLTRFEIQTRSQCARPPSSSSFSSSFGRTAAQDGEAFASVPSHERSCWMPRRFRRALVVVVDALRFDFTLYTPTSASARNGSSTEDGGKGGAAAAEPEVDYFVNNLPVINELLLANASNTLLFRFVADAPTTTLQRLKALNTGGIPTFLEAKNNFDSSELTEDNLILQMRDNGRGAVFMGDDTWEKLFPPHKHYFSHGCYPFPSFNVKDLHTVDDGIMQHIFPEMQRKPDDKDGWEVIVAHFLGVDHAGHRFGPSHPQMRQKLRQMNGILKQIIEAMEEDTILFVMGDHGMTADGNHGGHTENEVTAALFVYSPSPIFNKWQKLNLQDDLDEKFTRSEIKDDLKETLKSLVDKPQPRVTKHSYKPDVVLTKEHFRQVSQIDVVPTIALLLGLPIPFGNLGGIIPELFLGIAPPAYLSFERDELEERYKGPDGSEVTLSDGLFFEYLERKWGAKRSDQEMDNESEDSLQEWIRAFETLNAGMELNSRQIDAYLTAYADISPSFPLREVSALRRHLKEASALLSLISLAPAAHRDALVHSIRTHYRAFKQHHLFQKEVVDICRRLWATFDVASMAWGLVLLLSSICGSVFVILSRSSTSSFDFSRAFVSACFGGIFAICYAAVGSSISAAFHDLPAIAGTALVFSIIGLISPYLFDLALSFSLFSLYRWLSSLRPAHDEAWRSLLLSLGTVALFVLHGIGLFSNSFIEAEREVISFLLTTALLFYLVAAYSAAHQAPAQSSKATSCASALHRYQDVIKIAVMLFVLRFSPSIAGRHESITDGEALNEDAFPSPIFEPNEAWQARGVASSQSSQLFWQVLQFFSSLQFIGDTLLPLLLISATFFYSLYSFASIRTSTKSPSQPQLRSDRSLLLSTFILPLLFGLHTISLFSSAIYWTFQRLAILDFLPYLWKIFFPRIVYISSILSLVLLLSMLWRRRQQTSVYNVETLQGTFMLTAIIVCVPVLLVFGPNSCWTFTSFLCAPLLFLDVHARMHRCASSGSNKESAIREKKTVAADQDEDGAEVVNRDGLVRQRRPNRETAESSRGGKELLIDIRSPEGAQAEVPQPQEHFGVSGVIVWAFFAILLFYKSGHLCDFSSLQFESPFVGFEEMNMLIGAILMVLNTFGCYFLFILLLPLLRFWPAASDPRHHHATAVSREEVRRGTLKLVWLLMLIFAVKLFLTTLFVFLVRRHLMVWKVFAPKYIFDASATALVDLLLLVLYFGVHASF